MKLKVSKQRATEILARLKASSMFTLEVMKGDDTGMVQFYALMIRKGKTTLDKVPAYLRSKVKAELEK